MRPATFAFLACVLAAPARAQPSAARVAVDRATRAVETDSTHTLASALETRLAASPDDSAAVLGLATLALLTYRFDEADRHYDLLIDSLHAPPSWFATRAMLGRARLMIARDAALRASGAWYRRAATDAHALGDSATEIEALLGVASSVSRTTSDAAADSIFAHVASLLPNGDLSVRARFHCARAGPPVQHDHGELPEREETRVGAELARLAGADRVRATCLLGMAKAAYRDGDLAAALRESDTAAVLQRRARDRAGLAVTLQWRGYVLVTAGAYGQAWHALEEATKEANASGAEATASMASMFLASASLRLGDLASASIYAVQTESMLVRQGNARAITTLRGIQGDIARAAGDTFAARAAYADALARAGDFGGYPTIAPRRALAAMARARSQWATAATELELARTAARQVGLEEWEQRLTYDMAALALDRGDLDAAEHGFNGYLARLTAEERGRGYPARARLAEVQARRGNLGRAANEILAATDELDEWRASLDVQQIRLLAFQRTDDPVDPDLGLATIVSALAHGGDLDASFALAERRRARDLRDRLVRHDAARRDDARLAPAIRSPVAPPARLTASVVARALPDHRTAMVVYVGGRRDEPTTAFVITKAGVRVIALTPIDSLAPVITRYVGLLEAGGPIEQPAVALGRAVLDPVARALPAAVTRLIIVPDDVLHRVPFDALRLANGRYALEQFTIATAPSAAVAMSLWERPVRGSPVRLLAFGDPSFAAPDDLPSSQPARTALERRVGLARLAASRTEVRAAARFAAEGTVRLGADATEHYLRTSPLGGYHVLHFATHALVDDRSLTSTALALAPGGGADGFVSLADIAALPLGAELVVLSACRTAGGVLIGGEGVHGLASAFLGAGARAVVATTWQVEDARAARLVGDYYRALAGGASLGEALREAKLAALRRGAPVREWAAWTLVGDPLATLPLRERGRASVWWWGAGALFLFGVYGSLTLNRAKRDVRSAPSG